MAQAVFKMPVIFVDDIAVSKQFYQNLFELTIEHDFGENIVFKDGFSLWQRQRAEHIIFGAPRGLPPDAGRQVELYFETEDIEDLWQHIQENDVEVIHGLKAEAWGQRTCRMYDPDGYIIEVAEPMAAVVQLLAATGMRPAAIARKTQLSENAVQQILSAQQ
ncbi:MAG: VOC family protein [Thermoplasmatota archaeon]